MAKVTISLDADRGRRTEARTGNAADQEWLADRRSAPEEGR
ncbi:hypothetical protein [Streptomyces bauhiniae]